MCEKLLGKLIDDIKTVCDLDLLTLFISSKSFFNGDPILLASHFSVSNIAVFLMLHDEADGIAAAATTKAFVYFF